MEKIVISIKTLQTVLENMENDHMDLIELSIVPRQKDNRITYPAFLHMDGVSNRGALKDYEGIDEFSKYTVMNLSA